MALFARRRTAVRIRAVWCQHRPKRPSMLSAASLLLPRRARSPAGRAPSSQRRSCAVAARCWRARAGCKRRRRCAAHLSLSLTAPRRAAWPPRPPQRVCTPRRACTSPPTGAGASACHRRRITGRRHRLRAASPQRAAALLSRRPRRARASARGRSRSQARTHVGPWQRVPNPSAPAQAPRRAAPRTTRACWR